MKHGRWGWVGLVMVVGSSLSVAADGAPWQRLLEGEQAKKAEALEKQIEDHEVTGRFAEAVAPAEEVLALRRKLQGDDHYQTADAVRKLATLRRVKGLPRPQQQRLAKGFRLGNQASSLDEQGEHAEAESLYRKALAAYQEVLGPRHPQTATGYNNLAACLNPQGKQAEAERLFRKALAIEREVLGEDHPETAVGYNNLAGCLNAQGRQAEAEGLFRQALAISEKVLGPKHTQTATGYNNLATNLGRQGKYAQAERFQRRALALIEELLGAKHPQTIFVTDSLAQNLDGQGKHAEGELLHRKAVALCEEVLGPQHPETARLYSNLGFSLDRQDKYAEAEPLHRTALAIKEAVQGPHHIQTLLSYRNLGANLTGQGKYVEAEVLHRKAVVLCEKVLGLKHHFTGTCYHSLGHNLEFQGKHAEAEVQYRRGLAIREELLGPEHPQTSVAYGHLAGCLDNQGKYTEAETLHRKTLAIREKRPGPKHPQTGAAYNNLAKNLNAQGRHAEANLLYRKALAIGEEVRGRKHPGTAIGYNNLAMNLDAQGKYAEAQTYWRQAVETFEVARLGLASSGLGRAAAANIYPHTGLALALARQGKPRDAWRAAEAGLARGLLDDLTARALAAPMLEDQQRLRQRALRLEALDGALLPLLTAESLNAEQRQRRGALTGDRDALLAEIERDNAERIRREVFGLQRIQKALTPESALLFWVDLHPPGKVADARAWHYGCVVRQAGAPAWVRLPGSGPKKTWTEADDTLPLRLHEALAQRSPAVDTLAKRLAAQRLTPLGPHLEATKDLPAVRHLIAVPAGSMAGVPLEVLTGRYTVSYAPSGTVFARLAEGHRPLRPSSLLALGDPTFATPEAPSPEPPGHGLLVVRVQPGSNGDKAGIQRDDVLLSYDGKDLKTPDDLQKKETGEAVAAQLWRDGKARELRLQAGSLGLVFHNEPAPVVLKRRRELKTLLASTRGATPKRLPGTRQEVLALADLFPEGQTRILLGSQASEQQLDELAPKLKDYRVLHFATHGKMHPASAWRSALLLARDRLPDATERAKKGQKVYTGRLTVEAVSGWDLDADLVTLSACETGLGRRGGGEGYLGFSQVLFGAGARSLVLSLWQVDDTATALLMVRFYENLLGKREGLKAPLGRAEALREAKAWLRGLGKEQGAELAARLGKGELRGTVGPLKTVVKPKADEQRPYAHPYFWSAFILLGDPQ